MRIFNKIVLSSILVFAFSSFIQADPILIRQGNAVTNGNINNSAIYEFRGDGLTLVARPIDLSSLNLSSPQYLPGTNINRSINLFSSFGSVDFPPDLAYRGITTIINNNQYQSTFFGQGGGSLLIFSPVGNSQLPSIVFPTLTVQIPFTMQGVLRGNSCPINSFCTSIPQVEVKGQGFAEYTFSSTSDGKFYQLDRVFYGFVDPSPDPTPEPATILLLGTGLLGIFGYARRRK